MENIIRFISSYINCIFFVTFVILILINSIYVIKFSTTTMPDTFKIILYTCSLISLIVILFPLYIIFFNNQYLLININDLNLNIKYDMIGIFILILVIQLIRAIMDYIELRTTLGKGSLNLERNLSAFSGNFIIFSGIYLSIVFGSKGDKYYIYTGYFLCLFNIFRVVKYRLIDDLFKRKLRGSKSYLYLESKPEITLQQGIFNILLRSYMYISLSFAGIYTLLARGSYLYSRNNDVFFLEDIKRSGNILIDLIYFSIITLSTVGYGDIPPIGKIPKLWCSFEIITGYILLATIFAIIINKYTAGRD